MRWLVVAILALVIPAWPATAADEEPCRRCMGPKGDRIFGGCEAMGGTWIEVECSQRDLQLRASARFSKKNREKREALLEAERARARAAEDPANWPPPAGVTLAGFHQIMEGMDRRRVEHILGRPGRLQASGQGVEIYWWERPGANMSVTFQRGLVVGKAQFGL